MVTSFMEGTKGVEPEDTDDTVADDRDWLIPLVAVDPPWLLPLLFTNAGFVGIANVTEALEIINITFEIIGRRPASDCVQRRAT